MTNVVIAFYNLGNAPKNIRCFFKLILRCHFELLQQLAKVRLGIKMVSSSRFIHSLACV
jgi:hypothetical protein